MRDVGQRLGEGVVLHAHAAGPIGAAIPPRVHVAALASKSTPNSTYLAHMSTLASKSISNMNSKCRSSSPRHPIPNSISDGLLVVLQLVELVGQRLDAPRQLLLVLGAHVAASITP